MNSRERILATLSHREPDRVPIDLGSVPTTGVAADVYIATQKHLGFPEPSRIEAGLQLAYMDDEVAKMLGIDTRRVGPRPAAWKHWTFPGGVEGLIDSTLKISKKRDGTHEVSQPSGAVWFLPPDGWFFNVREESRPLQIAATPKEIEQFFRNLPLPTPEQNEQITKRVHDLRSGEPVALVGVFPSATFEAWIHRGYELFLTDFLAQPEMAETLMRCSAEYAIDCWLPVLKEVGDELDVIFTADDLGAQNGLLISEEHYRRQIKPVQGWLWGELRRLAPNAKLLYHSCGAVEPLIDDFIQMGADALNPIQTRAAGMDAATLKQKYGDQIVFWGGGIDSQGLLHHGGPEQIKENVRRQVEILAPGGGFIFAPAGEIQPATPVKNVMAMLETVQEFGQY